MLSSTKEVSVVIPFRGSAHELHRALASLAVQTMRSFEVVVVVDGIDPPNDAGWAADNIPRLEFLHNEAQRGPLTSRILGAEFGTGRYVWFMDHDDTVEPNFLEVMLAAAEDGGAQIVESPLRFFPESGPSTYYQGFTEDNSLHGTEILRSFLQGKVLNSLANKIVARKLWGRAVASIGDVGQERLYFAEDMLCTAVLCFHADTYRAINGTAYNYHYRAESTMSSFDADRLDQSVLSFEKVLNKLDLVLRQADACDVQAFHQREVQGGLTFFNYRFNHKLRDDVRRRLDAIRSQYLVGN